MGERLSAILVGLFVAGIGFSFLLADPESSSTRFFALFLGLMAVTFASTPIGGPGLSPVVAAGCCEARRSTAPWGLRHDAAQGRGIGGRSMEGSAARWPGR